MTDAVAAAPHPAPLAAPAPEAPGASPPPAPAEPRAGRPWLPVLVVALLALASSATSLGNAFAYDDRWIIETNPRVHDLGRWLKIFGESYWPQLSNGLYRPLTSIGFAAQWEAGGGTPFVFHLVNVALYVAASVAVYHLARRILSPVGAFVAAALFAVHPIHVEAVANIVGQSELSSGLMLVVAVTCYLRWREVPGALRGWRTAAIAAMGAAAMLLKEHGIVLIALLAAAELTVVRDPRPRRERVAELRPLYLAMVLVVVGCLWARYRVLGAFGGDAPHPVIVHLPAGERITGMIGLMPELARMLLWPARLHADYGPSQFTFATSFGLAHLAGLLWIAGALALLVVAWRRRSPAAFGLLWIAIAYSPVSNVLLPTGILLAERTLFAVTVGLAIALGAGAAWLYERVDASPVAGRVPALLLALVLLLAAVHSADRQRVWRDNETLFTTMVREQPRSGKAHYALGGWRFAQKRNAEGEAHWRAAIVLLPQLHRIRADLADNYKAAGMCTPAEPHYREVLRREPGHTRARVGLATCLARRGAFAESRRTLREGYAYEGSTAAVRQTERWLDGRVKAGAGAAARPAGDQPAGAAVPVSAATATARKR